MTKTYNPGTEKELTEGSRKIYPDYLGKVHGRVVRVFQQFPRDYGMEELTL